jgi:hypothetical protein
MAGAPVHDQFLANIEQLSDALNQRRDLKAQTCRPQGYAISHRLRPGAMLRQAPIVLPHNRRKGRREKVERNLAAHSADFVGDTRDEAGDGIGSKAKEARKKRIGEGERARPGLKVGAASASRRRVEFDRPIRKHFDNGVEVQTNGLGLAAAVVAKA